MGDGKPLHWLRSESDESTVVVAAGFVGYFSVGADRMVDGPRVNLADGCIDNIGSVYMPVPGLSAVRMEMSRR